jgi:uncharacterized membrane protein YfcA
LDHVVVVPLILAWRLCFAAVLIGAIVTSACARAPQRRVNPDELRRLVICALALYGVGGLASLTGHPGLAGLVYGAGIAVAALAAWLSRGRDREDPPDHGENEIEPPSPSPDGVPPVDWPRFEREFRDYARRRSPPSRVGGG